ncbi:MAG: EAL domain-containing protein [Desulfobacterales bacterium]|nr:EAL domain-containing protein [Desulfobacterales bacterium]
MKGDLRRAINNDELILHFQPKVSSSTGRPQAVEVIVRWYHPVHGIMPPDEFIPSLCGEDLKTLFSQQETDFSI